MTVEPGNSPMFFAYHVRSAFLTLESQMRETLSKWNATPEHFYVLRCDWTPLGITLDEIMAHAMLPRMQAIQAINDLVARDYIKSEAKDGCYSLTPEGVSFRTQLVTAYRAQVSNATQGLSDETIEAALTSLLTVQNNIQQI